jgi:hypothetical protein
MTRLIKVVMPLLLIFALVGTTFYTGLFRPDAAKSIVTTMTSNELVRTQMAEAFVDVMADDGGQIVSLLIRTNREQVIEVVTAIFGLPEQREQLGRVAQQLMDGLLAGQPQVALDPRPLFRPLYAAIAEVLPLFTQGEEELAKLDPIVLGEGDPLPDLGILKTLSLIFMSFWLIWFLLGWVLLRRVGDRAYRTLGWQAVSIGVVSTVTVIALPRVIASSAGDAAARALARTALLAISAAGIWISLALALAGVILILKGRRSPTSELNEGAVPSEGPTDSQ